MPRNSKLLIAFALLLLLVAPKAAQAAATFIVLNADPAGFGFNDPTPVAPVGGNTGTTLGRQRLNVLSFALNRYAQRLNSTSPIFVAALFFNATPGQCAPGGGVLAQAGPATLYGNFPNAPQRNVFFAAALADKVAGFDLDPTRVDLVVFVNARVGTPGCLEATSFYLGLDNNHGSALDLATVLLHEAAHGLGFVTIVNGATGEFPAGFPSSYDTQLLDRRSGRPWPELTPAQRADSAVNNAGQLVWNGLFTRTVVPQVLSPELRLRATPPAGPPLSFTIGTAVFGPAPGSSSGELMPVIDAPGGLGLACQPLAAANAAAVRGKFALLDRGGCPFVQKVRNAQTAGATGVVVADNAPGFPPIGLAGSDPGIVIPTVTVSQADGAALKAALQFRSRTSSGVRVNFAVDSTRFTGADDQGRLILFAPNPFVAGSSISHWDLFASRNLLMEPALSADLPQSIEPPGDVTLQALRDLGWVP